MHFILWAIRNESTVNSFIEIVGASRFLQPTNVNIPGNRKPLKRVNPFQQSTYSTETASLLAPTAYRFAYATTTTLDILVMQNKGWAQRTLAGS